MATQGALIRAFDYSEVQKDVARILGDKVLDNKYIGDPLRATYGYGQQEAGLPVIIGQIADDIHMGRLREDVFRIAIHCGIQTNPLIATLPVISQGDLVLNEHLDAYEAALIFLNANRFQLGVGQFSDENLAISHSRTTPWGVSNTYIYGNGGNTIRHAFTLDFGTANNARYFFNAGGQIRLSASRTGGSATQNNAVWTNLLSSMGTVIFNFGSTFSTGTGTGSSIGYYQLTNTFQQVFTRTGVLGSGAYTSKYVANDYTVYVRSDVANNSLGTSSKVYFDIYFNDDHVTNIYLNDITNGVISSNVTVRRATGSYVSLPGPSAQNTRVITQN